MTDITRLINSIKRRTSSARELGYDVLFVALDDLDVLADSLETALRANAAQAAHIEQLQDKFNKLAAENVALKRVPGNRQRGDADGSGFVPQRVIAGCRFAKSV